jgi:hypothetical protein
MRRLFLLAVVCLTGCGGNVVGPLQHRKPERVDDPCLTVPEQEARGRDRLAIPSDYPAGDPAYLTPNLYIDRPGPTGR